MSVEIDIGKL